MRVSGPLRWGPFWKNMLLHAMLAEFGSHKNRVAGDAFVRVWYYTLYLRDFGFHKRPLRWEYL